MATAHVFVRLKPTNAEPVVWKSKNNVVFDRGTIVEEYNFSGVFTEDNLSVFQALNDYSVHTRKKCLVESIFSGANETLFAYGQTGSGKTHSIFGREDGEPGLLHMFVQDLFAVRLDTPDSDVEIRLRCFEIYAESLLDLLEPDLGPQTEVFLKTARYRYQTVSVQSAAECLELLFHAEHERAVGTTSCNSRSSRSHCVVQFDVLNRPHGSDTVMKGTLSFVDLAGSERTTATCKVSSKRTRELNVSLASLVRLFRQLQQGELKETERRQSVLNKMIFDYVQPTCGIWLLFCVAQEEEYRDYTFSTLQLASDSRNIRLTQQKQTFMKVDTGLIPLSARGQLCVEDDALREKFNLDKNGNFVTPNSFETPDSRLAENVLCESLLSELDNRGEGSTAVPSDDVSTEDYAQALYRLERKYKELKYSRSAAFDKVEEENKELRNALNAERARANSLEGLIRSEQNFVLDTLEEINKFRGAWR